MFATRLPLFRLFGLHVRLHPSWFVLAALVLWSLGEGYFPMAAPGLGRFGMRVGGITLFVFGGVAELEAEPAEPEGEVLMALAGPLFSVAASGFAYGLSELAGGTRAGLVLDYLGFLNLLLAGFNMLPAFPMDGGRVLRACLWAWRGDVVWATRKAALGAAVLGLVLMAVGLWQLTEGALAAGSWWVVVGFFVRVAAAQACKQVSAIGQ